MSDTIVVPEWINKNLLEKVLQSSLNGKKFKLLDYTVKSATKKGEHIGSSMYRGTIRYNTDNRENDISMIIKLLPTNKELLYESSKIFETEIRTYKDLIPKFEKMLRAGGDQTVLGPRMLYYSLEPYKIVVFEDLQPSGYSTFENRMCNLEEAEIAYKKLAKWHACSYKFNYENNRTLEGWQDNMFKVPGTEENETLTKSCELLVKVLKSLPTQTATQKEITGKLEKIQGKLFPKSSKINEFSQSQGKLNVLNHGDFHIKNLMPQFDNNGNVKDIQIIDFQLCFWGSMAFDLLYVLNAILDPEIRATHRDEVIYKYFNIFIETLKKIGYKGELPKLFDLKSDLMRLGHLELWLAITFFPFMYSFNQNNANIEQYWDCKDARLSMYRNPNFLEEMQKLLVYYLYNGVLDEEYYEE